LSYRDDLVTEINRLRARHGIRRDERDTFPAWVLLTAATLNEEDALDALVGGSHDRGLDAVYFDDSRASRSVWIVQGKLPDRVNGSTEPREMVASFADLANYLTKSDDQAPEFWSDLARNQFSAAARFREARDRVRRRYPVSFIYASLWRFDPDDEQEARDAVTAALPRASIAFLNGDTIGRRLDDYVYDITPSVGPIALSVLEDHVPAVEDGGVAAYSFSIQGSVLANLYDDVGDQLFARNIRWYMGENPVNLDITATARDEPERFWLYNNGVTFICDGANFDMSARRRMANIEGGQVVNGQQTTRTLHALWKTPRGRVQVERVRVPVRVIEIGHEDALRRDNLISGIVRATNWQTAVSMADLRSNDRRQIELYRDLFARGYIYKRKRAATGEEPVIERPRNYVATFSKEDLARAVAGVDAPGRALVAGITPLFDEHYEGIFRHTTDYYLACLWLWRIVRDRVGGDPVRKSAKYVVHYEVWRDARRFLEANLGDFADACAHGSLEVVTPLVRAIDAMFEVAERCFKKHAQEDGVDIPATTYFKRETTYQEVIRTWNTNLGGREQVRYARAMRDLESALSN
jgi:hypothetical protein